jgi:hypothetical protein
MHVAEKTELVVIHAFHHKFHPETFERGEQFEYLFYGLQADFSNGSPFVGSDFEQGFSFEDLDCLAQGGAKCP